MARNALNCAVLRGQKTRRISAARMTRLQPRLLIGLLIVRTSHERPLTIGSSHELAKRKCNVLPQCDLRHGRTMRGLRHEINAAGMERMTAREPRDRQPPAPNHAVMANWLLRVALGGGIEAAGRRQQRRDGELVNPDQADEQEAYRL